VTDESRHLAGLRILVVEDVLLMAEVIRDQLEECGCSVVGPVAHLAEAIAVAREALLDGAVLDVNLAGERSFPVAAILSERRVPYVFLTGYDSEDVFPAEYRNAPRLGKPFRYQELVDAMTSHLRPRA
jgi:CheY-like chemotaxis protein